MSDLEEFRFEGSELASVQDKVAAVQSQLSDLAQIFSAKLGQVTEGSSGTADVSSISIKRPTHGIKVLIVHTADGGCYVYDGNRGVCRACDGVSDGET